MGNLSGGGEYSSFTGAADAGRARLGIGAQGGEGATARRAPPGAEL